MKPCLTCGEPSTGTHCPQHQPVQRTARQRGYTTTWDKLSRRARRIQPFCSDCGTIDDLQADHSPEAWRRQKAGLPVRLLDIDVVCGTCNRRRGAARGHNTRGDTPPQALPGPEGSREKRYIPPRGIR